MAGAEKLLRSLFDDEATAARARYELAGIYEAAGRRAEAAQLLHDATVVLLNDGAGYVGTGACKKCHLKQYMSWKTKKGLHQRPRMPALPYHRVRPARGLQNTRSRRYEGGKDRQRK